MGIKSKLNNPFASLKYRDFRYYWISLFVSLTGTWMQNIAQPWLAYTLTKSPLLLSFVGALQFLPSLLFSLFAGVIIDKHSKKRILLFTQSSSFLITLAFALLIQIGCIKYWIILIMAFLLGMVNALDVPTRQSFIVELVNKEDLSNAIALNASIFNIARIIGPALAGILMGWLGIAFVFFMNSVSFAFVVAALLIIKPKTVQNVQKADSNILTECKGGIKYVFHKKILFKTMLFIGIVATFAMNFNVLIPVFTKVVLKQAETQFGFLMSFLGIGSFIGAIAVSMASKLDLKDRILNIGPLLVAAFLIITGFTNTYFAAGLCLFATGFFLIVFNAVADSTIQINTSNEFRGRVMSIYSLVFCGTTPIGNIYAGSIANFFGPKIGFIFCGLITILLLLLYDIISKVKYAR